VAGRPPLRQGTVWAAVASGAGSRHDGRMHTLPAAAPVELLHWPADAASRAVLARGGVPCLLLVAAEAEPPRSIGPTEDWVRLPADERDVAARARALCGRLARGATERPSVADGVVTRGSRRVDLTDAESQALGLLLGTAGVVSRRDLSAAVWPAGPPGPRSLEALVYRLRVRLTDLNIQILAVRGRGYVIDTGAVAGRSPEPAR
jgi:hypothetical protein